MQWSYVLCASSVAFVLRTPRIYFHAKFHFNWVSDLKAFAVYIQIHTYIIHITRRLFWARTEKISGEQKFSNFHRGTLVPSARVLCVNVLESFRCFGAIQSQNIGNSHMIEEMYIIFDTFERVYFNYRYFYLLYLVESHEQ